MRLLGYCLRETWLGIRRNPFLSLATVLTAAIAMLVLSVFLLGAANLANMIEFVERQVQVSIYLKDDVQLGDRNAILSRLRDLEGVDEAVFVSKEEALERLRVAFGDNASLLEGIEEFNPLRDSIEVRVLEAAAVDAVVAAVKDNPSTDDISYGRELVARLIVVTRSLRLAVLGLAGLLGLATLVLIQNSVRLSVFARREEVLIMRLVGATDGVIRLPFVFEGIVLSCVGAALAAAAAGAGYVYVWRFVGYNLAFLPILPAASVMQWLVPAVVVAAALIGAIGSLLALRRWLRE